MYLQIIAAIILVSHNPISGNFFIDFFKDAGSYVTAYGRGQQALEESAEKSKLLLKQAETINEMVGKTNSQTTVIENGTQAVAKSIDGLAKTQAETNQVLTGAQLIVAGAGAVYIVKSAKEGVEWVREWRNPDPEKVARKAAAIKSMEALKATSALNKCLVYKRKEAKNSQGIPTDCEEAYNEFVGALGFDKAEQTVQAFKRFNQQ